MGVSEYEPVYFEELILPNSPTAQFKATKSLFSSLALFFLVCFLSVAGIGKLIAVAMRVEIAFHPVISATIAFLELLLSLGLVWGSLEDRVLAWRSSVCLSFAFFLNLMWTILKGKESLNCDCLGVFKTSYLPTWAMVVILFLLLMLSIPVAKFEPIRFSSLVKYVGSSISISSLLGLTFAFIANDETREDIVSFVVPRYVSFVTADGKETRELNIGTVKANNTFRFPVAISNFGNKPVRIIGYKQSCRCARVISCPSLLDAGQTACAEVEYESQLENGSQNVLLPMYLDEPNQAALSVKLKFSVKSAP
jgi:hypothetical protein